jgi:hypothetical protein
LVDAHLDIISGLPALPRVSASIANHETFDVDLGLGFWQFVVVDYLVNQVGDVNACIALSCDVKFVFL